MLRRLSAFIIVLVGLFLLLAVQVGAFPPYWLNYSPRTFYVDATDGNNANTGTAEGQAWQTIAKVNAATFRPGDRILFQRGETWSGTRLIPPSDGARGAPITFGNYGTGALPIIIGDATACIVAPAVTPHHWLIIDGIDCNGNSTSNAGIQLGGHDNVIRNCIARSCTSYGIWIPGGATAGVTHDVWVLNNTVYSNLGPGIFANGTVAAAYYHVTVEGNTCYSNGNAIGEHGIYLSDGYGNTVRKNVCYGNYDGGLKFNDQTGVSGGGSVMELNYSYNNSVGIYVEARNNIIRNNLCYSNTGYGIGVGDHPTGTLICYNTVVSNTYYALKFYETANPAKASGVTIENNIFVQDATVNRADGIPIHMEAPNQQTWSTWDYNTVIWLNSGGTLVATETGGSDHTWVQWQADVGEAHGLNLDPNFVTDYSDLHLSATSPCSNTADSSVFVVEDKDDKNRDGQPDMGCYEY